MSGNAQGVVKVVVGEWVILAVNGVNYFLRYVIVDVVRIFVLDHDISSPIVMQSQVRILVVVLLIFQHIYG